MKIRALIEHPTLPPFEPQLKAILEFGFDGGVRSLESAGYKLGDDLVNDDAREHFRRGLFSSFGHTQSLVGMRFIELEKLRRELLGRIKTMRLRKDRALDDSLKQLEAVENRQTIFRRLMDGILWVLLPKVWMAHHLAFQNTVSQPDPDELMKILAVAWKQNQENERAINLVADLTSIVQVGDIIRIRWDKDGVYIRLQEIKSGPVNEALMDIIDATGGTLSASDIATVEAKFGPYAKDQASRMVRQRERFKKLENALRSDEQPTILPNDELGAALVKTKPPKVLTYLTKLPALVTDAKTRGVSVHGIDGCLWLMAVSESGLAQIGEPKQLPHYLFHVKHPELKCRREEIPLLKREAPLVNLAVHNMQYVMSRSPLIWYPKDLVLDVIMGRIMIFAQFDVDLFFRSAAEVGIKLQLIMGKEAEGGKQSKTSSPMLENPKAYGVKATFSNGREFRLRSSLFRSIYSDLVFPSQILQVIMALDNAQKGVQT
jgi:hypothetical protein